MGVPNSDVDAADGATSTARRGSLRSNSLRLVYLGSLAKNRRLEVLIEMVAILRGMGISARLILIGEGPSPEDRVRLESLVATLGVNDLVEFTGQLPRDAALERAREADIGLSPIFPAPELIPASPTKLVEYMSLGLPVVANDHPDQRIVLRESSSGLCVPWGARYFARAVAWISRLTQDQRDEMGASGRRWVLCNRSYERIADDVEATYRASIAAGRWRESRDQPRDA
jgi:glycosyltransferase involved in cell wall biosynthesis